MALDNVPSSDIPELIRPEHDNIPQFLRKLDQWIVWKGEWQPAKRKYSKIPVHPQRDLKIDPLDPKNHMPFEGAWAAYEGGKGSGIGFVMTGKPVAVSPNGDPLYLVALDLDKVLKDQGSTAFAKDIYRHVGSYTEISPSGEGLRVFALSNHKPRSGQTPMGEIYAEKHFLTVTGHQARKGIVENTAAIRAIDHEWWGTTKPKPLPNDKAASLSAQILRSLAGGSWPETPENIERIKRALSYIDPDCARDTWRDIIWAIMSTGWACAMQIALEWSQGSDSHWGGEDQGAAAHEALEGICNSFDLSRGITLGTLYYHAYAGGMPRVSSNVWDNDTHPAGGAAPTMYKLLSRQQLAGMPEVEWIIPGVLPDAGVASIYGVPGSGKSFVAIDLASRISLGHGLWFAREVEKRPVVYVALEGGRGIENRLKAWDKANGAVSDVQTVLQPFSFLEEEDVVGLHNSVVQCCPKGAVVFIDTLAQASPGADENASKDMGTVLAAATSIASEIEGLVVLIHHSGKDASRGLRGHSSLNGAMDAVMCIDRNATTNIRSWKVTKMKDADDGATGLFELNLEQLGVDTKGNAITSCSVKEINGVFAATKTATAKLGANQKSVLEALKADDTVGGWSLDEVVEIAKTALTDIASKNRSTRAKEVITSLGEAGHLIEDEGVYTLN